MRANEYFDRMDKLNRLIRLKLRRIDSLRDSLSVASPTTDSEQVTHTVNPHASTEIIANIVDMEQEVNTLVDELVDLKNELSPYVQRLPDELNAMLIKQRYFQGNSSAKLAATYSYSQRRIQQFLKQAADQLDVFLSEE